MPARRGRPPKTEAGLSRQAVLDAGLRLMRRDGLDALTMRALAAELDVRATSLYRYLPSKDALLDALADELFAGLDVSGLVGADWRASLAAMARAIREYLLARRDAARLIAGRFTTGYGLRNIEAMLAVLRAAGLSDRDAAFALYGFATTIFGLVAAEQNRVAGDTPPREYLDGLADRLRGASRDGYPNVVDLAAELTAPDLAGRYEFTVARLIDGIASLGPG